MNTFGTNFRISIFGESHSPVIGMTVDGMPSGILVSIQFLVALEKELKARAAGPLGTTLRIEPDKVKILSGVYRGYTTGAPLTIEIANTNVQSKDYEQFKDHWRPGHTDFVAAKKFGYFNDPRGSGHFSGRLTVALVVAGCLARQVINKRYPNLEVHSELIELGSNQVFEQWPELIEDAMKKGDSMGGIVRCETINMPIGLGEPFFDSMESMISHIIFSIPGVRGIEFGTGFESSRMYGSICNDAYMDANGKTVTNHCGGINGGISNGNNLLFNVAFKPTSTINKPQKTYSNKEHEMTILECKGRHDTCFVLRTPPIVTACTWIVLADLLLRNTAHKYRNI